MSKKKSSKAGKTATPNTSRPLQEPLDGNDKGKVRLFVYGTLKRGHHNNGLLQRADARFMGFDTITGPFRLVSLGGFPGIIYDDRIEGANTVYGEVYHFNPDKLESFDWLEGYPRFYDRTKWRTDFMDKKCWFYHLPYSLYKDHPQVDTGCWTPTAAEENVWQSRGILLNAS